MNTLAFAIVGHMVGDFLLQNDWMSSGKKKSSLICAIHCAIWTASVLLFVGDSWWSPWTALFLFATHFIQDRTQVIKWYMNHFGQKIFATPPMSPWSMIVVDNTFHLVALAFVAKHYS